MMPETEYEQCKHDSCLCIQDNTVIITIINTTTRIIVIIINTIIIIIDIIIIITITTNQYLPAPYGTKTSYGPLPKAISSFQGSVRSGTVKTTYNPSIKLQSWV